MNIFQGTDSRALSKGVGHYLHSVMPGVADNSVLAGHRDTVFSHLDRVKVGDFIIIGTEEGTYIYQVHRLRIVDKNDRTVIVPTKQATLTLSTCYPFRFIGNAPKRYIVQATLIPPEEAVSL
jgi:sortase A